MLVDPYTVVLAPNPSLMTGPGTNTIILGHGVEGATVIDPAVDEPEYLERLIAEGEKRGGLRRILITHGHPDHMGGALELRKRLRISVYAFSLKGTPICDLPLVDGMELPVGEDTLRVIHTPGHRFDHLCFYLTGERILFAGDTIAGNGTVVIIPPEGNMSEYMQSLQRLQELDLAAIVPAHGPTIDEPHERITEYIEHRLSREKQILDVLQAIPRGTDIPDIVGQVYRDVDPALHELATQSVEAHLLKLESEGRARREGPNLWSPA